MKKYVFAFTLIFVFTSACNIVHQVAPELTRIIENPIVGEMIDNQLWRTFNQKSPVSTTFNDAKYEAKELHDFEPAKEKYLPLHTQPKAKTGGYVLKSGLYTMDAQSFCLRGYTHGPTKGDGHLYAPMKGKKARLVQAVIERFADKPAISQKSTQVLLWAILAGADMDVLGAQHTKTLNALFTAQDLLEFRGREMLGGIADTQMRELQQLAFKSPKLQNMMNANKRIRTMACENKSFQEIEKIAIIAGVAPAKDLVRVISKGRWSYHPDGFYVRFFPNGYPQTRVDVYVPPEGAVSRTGKRPQPRRGDRSPNSGEVIFNPATMVASPANQSSQRIGISARPRA